MNFRKKFLIKILIPRSVSKAILLRPSNIAMLGAATEEAEARSSPTPLASLIEATNADRMVEALKRKVVDLDKELQTSVERISSIEHTLEVEKREHQLTTSKLSVLLKKRSAAAANLNDEPPTDVCSLRHQIGCLREHLAASQVRESRLQEVYANLARQHERLRVLTLEGFRAQRSKSSDALDVSASLADCAADEHHHHHHQQQQQQQQQQQHQQQQHQQHQQLPPQPPPPPPPPLPLPDGLRVPAAADCRLFASQIESPVVREALWLAEHTIPLAKSLSCESLQVTQWGGQGQQWGGQGQQWGGQGQQWGSQGQQWGSQGQQWGSQGQQRTEHAQPRVGSMSRTVSMLHPHDKPPEKTTSLPKPTSTGTASGSVNGTASASPMEVHATPPQHHVFGAPSDVAAAVAGGGTGVGAGGGSTGSGGGGSGVAMPHSVPGQEMLARAPNGYARGAISVEPPKRQRNMTVTSIITPSARAPSRTTST